jgi:Predicted signal transduction protein with a C-terminal ATPase domain
MKKLMEKKGHLSIRFQILFVCILSLLIMQIILMVSYYQFREAKIEANNKYFSNLITQMSDSVEVNCTYLNGMVRNIAYSKVVQEYLETKDISYLQSHYKDVKNFIIPFADINEGIKDIAVIGTQGNVVNINIDNQVIQNIAEEIPEKRLWYYTGQHMINLNGLEYNLFTVGANVYSTDEFTRKEKMGTVLITFNMKSIFGLSGNQVNSRMPSMLIYDRNKKLVYSSTDKEIPSEFDAYFDRHGVEKANTIKVDKKIYYIKTGSFRSMGGKVVFVITRKGLISGLESTRFKTILISAIVFVFMLLLSLFVTNNIVVPIRQFVNYLNKVGQGDLRMMKQPVKLSGATELIIMSDKFNRMMEEINDLNHRLVNTSTRLYESELAKKQAELEYMYSQINPHFLFNTLETIKGCAVEEEADKTFQMINSLGKMFRYCVRSGNIVSVEEEIKVIDSYMYLQKIRFGSKLNFISQIDHGIYSAAIPKMILQPLIENAVIHGMEEEGKATVWLSAKEENNIIYFYVQDDGVGIEETKRLEIIEKMNQQVNNSHIGISNVNYRLKHIYGDQYGVDINKMSESGFCISINFPYERLQKYDQSARFEI